MMFEKIIGIPRELWPEIEDLPGELCYMAQTIEDRCPGMGVEITLMISSIFGKQSLYIYSTEKLKLKIRNQAIRNDCDAGMPVKRLALKYNLSTRQIENIINSPPSYNVESPKQQTLF